MTLDDDYNAFRKQFWLATDRAYKTAVEAIGRKRAAMQNINQPQDLTDLWKAPAVNLLQPPMKQNVDLGKWTARVRELSAVFKKYPDVLTSQVNFEAMESTHYMYNSEGTTVRVPDGLTQLQVRATAQAPDGMTVRDAAVLVAPSLDRMPADAAMTAAVQQVAENVRALAKAPFGETYSGPVLFEGDAAAQVFAELIAPNVTLPRKPVGEPGRPVPFYASEFEGKIGSRVLPEFLDVVDDAKQTAAAGKTLLGNYAVDDEGVTPQEVTLIEKGKLKGFLLTRQPVRGFDQSNGHARLPGGFGANTAAASNLFVKASESVKPEELKQKLIETIKQRNKPYGLIIRKMDYPSTASIEEIRRIATSSAQSGATARPTSIPLLTYRVYPDGREELVRGLRFRGFGVRSLKDIIAVSNQQTVFSFLYNQAPFSLVGGGGFVAPISVVAPSFLIDDLDLEKPQEDMPKLPIVPPPAISASE
jgi:predicted Zn-dependent protease